MVKFCCTLLLLPMKRMMVSGLLLLKKQKWCRWRTERRRDGFEDFYASVGRRRTKREETLPKQLRDDEVNDDVGRDERLRRLNHLPLLPCSSRRTAAMTTRATTRATTARSSSTATAWPGCGWPCERRAARRPSPAHTCARPFSPALPGGRSHRFHRVF